MKKHHVIGASAVALCAAIGVGPALAGGGATRVLSVSQVVDYNAAEVKTAGDILTVPSGHATYSLSNVAGAGSLEINSRFTVTLPSGFSFASQPALISPGATTFTLASGGIGAQSVTFTVGGAPMTGGEALTLNTFSVQGATALETPIPVPAALPITMQATNNAEINDNDAKPLTAPFFGSEPGAGGSFVGVFLPIDLTSPVLGTEFGTNPSTDTTTALLSGFAFGAQTTDALTQTTPVLSPDGLLNTISSSDTATLTVSGFFNGIASAFLATAPTCSASATVAGSAATVTPTSITFTGIPPFTETYSCVVASGTTLLQENLNGIFATASPDTATDFLSVAIGTVSPGVWSYVGGGIISVSNFFTGDDAGYATLLRVNNAGTVPSNIFALVQPDTGGPALSGSLGSLGAGEGTVFSEAEVAAAVSGLDLANSGQRATLQLIVTGPDGSFAEVKASTFLVNPGGVVDNVGVQQNFESER